MGSIFPSAAWLEDLKLKLNSDSRYAHIARNWEGDLCIYMEPGGPIKEAMVFYLDLWHGTCRNVALLKEVGDLKPIFLMSASFENLTRIVKGELDPMQAMMTRKLTVKGSMAYMMRNVPTVLDFVRCAREITDEIIS